MVKLSGVVLWASALTALAAVQTEADLPAYRLNETALADVITPVPLTVVDRDATAALQQRESRKIQLFALYVPDVAADLERTIQQEVDAVRSEFLDLLREEYGKSSLLRRDLGTPRFTEFSSPFLAKHAGFPRITNLVNQWATGNHAEPALDAALAPFLEIFARPVRPDKLPSGARPGTNGQVRLLTVSSLEASLDPGQAFTNSVLTPVTNLITLSAAKRELRAAYGDRRIGFFRWVLDRAEPNCRLDPDLTARVREQRVSGLLVTTRYEAGEAIVRAGEKVDAEALAALTTLREQLRNQTLEQVVVVQQAAVEQIGERAVWLAGLLGFVLLVCGALAVRYHRAKRQALWPVLASSITSGASEAQLDAGPTVVEAPPAGQDEWRQRALQAERRADQVTELARSEMLPHLAWQLKDGLVQELAAQREGLLSTQEALAEQMKEMEERLRRIHAPLHERLSAYEQRIRELQEELVQRGEENRTLIRAQIAALQRLMQQEREQAEAEIK